MSLAPGRSAGRLVIDLDAVAENHRRLAATAASARLAPVVKANAYGLGIGPIAGCLAEGGASLFFVAHLAEGIELRQELAQAGISVLNGLGAEPPEIFCRHRLVPVLNSLAEIERWAAMATHQGARLQAFVHLDTGINRLGLEEGEIRRLVERVELLDAIDLLGWISHFACADDPASPMTQAQAHRFFTITAHLPPAPLCLANSSGIFRGNHLHRDIVRPGCALFGINPTPEAANPMCDVVRLEVPILQVRELPAGATVGYGATHTLPAGGRLATLAIGYGDGYPRCLGGRGAVSIDGHLAPVVGRISMDLTMVDVSALPGHLPQPRAVAIVIGPHRPPDQVAREAETIGYEILTNFGRRYVRSYVTHKTGLAAT